MATLTIEDFPEALLAHLRKLSIESQRSLDQEVIHLLEQALHAAEKSAQLRA